MNKLNNVFKLLLIIIIFYSIFKYNYLLNNTIIIAFNLWLNKVFPSLFIMFVLSDIIINSNIFASFTKPFNNIFNRIFKTNGRAFEVFLLSFISGTPTNAYILKEMLNKNLIEKNTANKLIEYTFFSNPLFLYNMLLITFNKNTTIKIIIIHYFTNIIIALLKRNRNYSKINLINKGYSKNIIGLIPNAIKKSIDNMFLIFGTIAFYMIISNIIIKLVPLNQNYTIIIKGILEITQSLSIMNTITYNSITKEIIALSIISFGGLSIHTQVAQIVNETDIKYKHFLIGRIKHVLFGAITYLITITI